MELFNADGKPVKILSIAEMTVRLKYPHKMVLRRQIKAGKIEAPGVQGVVRVGNADGIVVLAEE